MRKKAWKKEGVKGLKERTTEEKIKKIQGIERRPSLQLGVVAVEKETFGSPSTLVTNFTYNFAICNFLYYHWCTQSINLIFVVPKAY